MKTVIGTLTALMVWAAAGLALAEQAHTAKGRIVAADRTRVIMVLENGHRHTLELSQATRVYDEFGQRSVQPLGPGDLVQEDCVSLPDGRFLARRITLQRAAWREITSPEF
jgi:hypothetical protein